MNQEEHSQRLAAAQADTKFQTILAKLFGEEAMAEHKGHIVIGRLWRGALYIMRTHSPN